MLNDLLLIDFCLYKVLNNKAEWPQAAFISSQGTICESNLPSLISLIVPNLPTELMEKTVE